MEHIEKLRNLAERKASTLDALADVDSRIRDAVISASNSGVSAADIADALGVSSARVYQIKKGTR